MIPASVSRVLSLIPERTTRAKSGAAFLVEGSACPHPERLAHVARLLHWLSPLDALTKEDQRALGLIAANGRPVQAEEDDEEAFATEPL